MSCCCIGLTELPALISFLRNARGLMNLDLSGNQELFETSGAAMSFGEAVHEAPSLLNVDLSGAFDHDIINRETATAILISLLSPGGRISHFGACDWMIGNEGQLFCGIPPP